MADRIPVKAIYTGSDATALGELASGDTIAASYINGLAGEVTGTGGATVIADNIIDEANLKVSNSPTNGQFLSAQSGNTGGLTWAAASGGGGGIGEFDGTSIKISSDDTALAADDGTSNNNIALGQNALLGLTTGTYNIALGKDCLKVNNSTSNIAIGWETMKATTGSSNVAIGSKAMNSGNVAAGNTAIGTNAMSGAGSTGAYNVAVGNFAGKKIASAGNIAIGYYTMGNTSGVTGAYNVAVGHESVYTLTSGASNIGIGKWALKASTTADSNTAVGHQSLMANTTGSSNTAVGHNTLVANTTGGYNIALGYSPLAANTTGSNNIAFGNSAMEQNTAGGKNLALGTQAGWKIQGDENVALGYQALRLNTTASDNVAVGAYALTVNTTGTKNIGIGYGAGDAITTGSNNTIIGDYAGTTTLADTVAIYAGTTERLKVTSSGLTINGAAVGGGGDMVFISTQTTGSSVASVSFTGLGSTYNHHKLVMSWTYGTSTSFGATIDFLDDSTDIGTISHMSRHYGSNTSTQANQSYFMMNLETTAESFLAEWNIYGLGETNKPLYGIGRSFVDASSNGTAQLAFWKDAVSGETVDGIIIKALWGDIPSGAKFTLYGLKDS
jgi:hypothetical protein